MESTLLHLVWNTFKGKILHRLHPLCSLDWIIALRLPITYDNHPIHPSIHPIPIPSNRHIALKKNSHEPGMDVPPGEAGGSSPPRHALWGGQGSASRPVKMIKTAGKLRGKIKAWISIFSNNKTILQHWTIPNPACQWDMQEKVKSESTFLFFANRASKFVLENLSTYEIASPCPKYHS